MEEFSSRRGLLLEKCLERAREYAELGGIRETASGISHRDEFLSLVRKLVTAAVPHVSESAPAVTVCFRFDWQPVRPLAIGRPFNDSEYYGTRVSFTAGIVKTDGGYRCPCIFTSWSNAPDAKGCIYSHDMVNERRRLIFTIDDAGELHSTQGRKHYNRKPR